MTNGIVLGARSRQNDRKRTRHSGRVWVLQMPLRAAVPIVFGPLNWFGGNSPCRIGIVFAAHRHLADWDAHYETEITKVAEIGELRWRGLNFITICPPDLCE